jgi:RNA polymerase sigma factor (sigma-70 family)
VISRHDFRFFRPSRLRSFGLGYAVIVNSKVQLPGEPPDPNQGQGAALRDRSAVIERLFREHNQSLVRFLCARLASEHEAREVAQEAYVRLLQLDQPGAIGFLRAFLFKTAANLAVDRLRHRRIVREASQKDWFDLTFQATPDSEAVAEQTLAIIEAALAELPPRCREAFLLARLGGLGSDEIGVCMDISARMVRLYLARALLHCRERLDVSQVSRAASREGGP